MDVASLGVGLKYDDFDKGTQSLRAFATGASDAERAAKKMASSTNAAGQSSEQFSKRVRSQIETLQFQAQQFARNGTEQERYTALRRAGVMAESAAGAAVLKNVQILQEQRAAQQAATEAAQRATEAARTAQLQAAESARAAQQRSNAVRKVVADYEFERAQLGRNSAEREKNEALRRAGVTASTRARLTHRDGNAVADGPEVDLVPRSPGDGLALGSESRVILRILPAPGAAGPPRFAVIAEGE